MSLDSEHCQINSEQYNDGEGTEENFNLIEMHATFDTYFCYF